MYTKQNNQRLGSFYAKGMSSITVVRDWNLVSLAEMREIEELGDMALLRPGQRLSIQPVSSEEWSLIKKLGKPEKL